MKVNVFIVAFFTMVTIFANAQNTRQPLSRTTQRGAAGQSQHQDPLLKKSLAVMTELGTDLDVAESSLRVLINEPVKGSKFSDKQISCENQLKAAMAVMNFEMRHPGYLQGKHGNVEWAQYTEVRELFNKLSNKYEFFFNSSSQTTQPPSNGAR